VGLLVAGLAGGIEYVGVREDKARLEERQKADAAVFAAKDAALKTQGDQLRQATDAFEDFKRQQDQRLTALQLQFAAAKTPAQSADLTALLLGLKAGEVKVGGTKEAPTLEVPRARQEAYEQACEECKLRLTSATKNLELATQREAFLTTQHEDDADKIVRLTRERDDAKKFSTGGSTWTRVKHESRAGVFGAAVAYVLLQLTGHVK